MHVKYPRGHLQCPPRLNDTSGRAILDAALSPRSGSQLRGISDSALKTAYTLR